jgi:hypothetical protein
MKCTGTVTYANGQYRVANAKVALIVGGAELASTRCDENGTFQLSADVPDGKHKVRCELFGEVYETEFEVVNNADRDVSIDCGVVLELHLFAEIDGKPQQTTFATEGKRLIARAELARKKAGMEVEYRWMVRQGVSFAKPSSNEIDLVVPDGYEQLGLEVVAIEKNFAAGRAAHIRREINVPVRRAEVQKIGGDVGIKGPVALQDPIRVRLDRTKSDPTLDQALWVAIRNRTRAMSFGRYQEFMNRALCWEERRYEVPAGIEAGAARDRIQRDLSELGTNLHGVGAYQALKSLTETFLLLECGVRIEGDRARHRVPFDFGEEIQRLGEPFTLRVMEEKLKAYLGDRAQLPYITRVVRASFPELDCEGDGWEGRLIAARINEPCLIELIWSYWMEEGMLVQTMNAVVQRFQNVRATGDRDPLANLEITPLRALNNLLWGFVADEPNRLSVRRRAYEYVHHYGLTLFGKAASNINAADRRSKFLEAFHNLLFQASVFFKEDFQTTVIADGFPLLNSLKEVHLILAQGAGNQFGDLPWTARVEMLLMQYMLARGELRDFLASRAMVPYKEPWEAQVDAMKTLQGWPDATVSHFRDLAVYGEQILLSIRYGDWINVNDEDSAKNWARYFRPEIQAYLHAYRAVTGIDLTNPDTVDATIPGIYLQKRTVMQRSR